MRKRLMTKVLVLEKAYTHAFDFVQYMTVLCSKCIMVHDVFVR